MKHDELDRILSREPEILPSSGFVDSVMDSVRREAAAPPIPFPWRRALPGLFAAAFVLAALLVVGLTIPMRAATAQQLPKGLLSTFALILEGWKTVGATWIVLALALSFVSVKLSMRFVHDKM